MQYPQYTAVHPGMPKTLSPFRSRKYRVAFSKIVVEVAAVTAALNAHLAAGQTTEDPASESSSDGSLPREARKRRCCRRSLRCAGTPPPGPPGSPPPATLSFPWAEWIAADLGSSDDDDDSTFVPPPPSSPSSSSSDSGDSGDGTSTAASSSSSEPEPQPEPVVGNVYTELSGRYSFVRLTGFEDIYVKLPSLTI